MPDAIAISPQEFAALCRCLDLRLTPDEAERLREAHAHLKALLARLPREESPGREPALLFAPAGTRLAR